MSSPVERNLHVVPDYSLLSPEMGGAADLSTPVCRTHVLKPLYNTQHLHSYSLGSVKCN